MAGTVNMLRIGVTGGIGSGKSEVCRLFERELVPVLYADLIANELSESDPDLRDSIKKLLGYPAYKADGTMDRSYVASRVFSNKSIRKKINTLIHPKVDAELDRRFLELERRGTSHAIVEAALIYEAGLDKKLDAVVVVEADKETRIGRVVQRDGSTREAVLDRMKAQLDTKQKIRKADYVVYNNGSTAELEEKVKLLNVIFRSATVEHR
jgi:dephospho-CoA kinase